MLNLDTMVKAGQKVQVTRTVTFVYDLDIEGDEAEISVETLQEDIPDMTEISDVMYEMDNLDISSDIAEITRIY